MMKMNDQGAICAGSEESLAGAVCEEVAVETWHVFCRFPRASCWPSGNEPEGVIFLGITLLGLQLEKLWVHQFAFLLRAVPWEG